MCIREKGDRDKEIERKLDICVKNMIDYFRNYE